MKEHDYTIESLSSTFATHADQADKQFQETLESPHKDEEWVKSDEFGFNIARALSVICCEIEKLQHKVGK